MRPTPSASGTSSTGRTGRRADGSRKGSDPADSGEDGSATSRERSTRWTRYSPVPIWRDDWCGPTRSGSKGRRPDGAQLLLPPKQLAHRPLLLRPVDVGRLEG